VAEEGFEDRFGDEDYPAYSMGAAADMLGVGPTFLRALGAAHLIEPKRSGGGHRRYSRYHLRLAARAREVVDQGTPVEAACRIIVLEDQLAETLHINAHQRTSTTRATARPDTDTSAVRRPGSVRLTGAWCAGRRLDRARCRRPRISRNSRHPPGVMTFRTPMDVWAPARAVPGLP
jgi:DNA-binding transcriptional MerR regulator